MPTTKKRVTVPNRGGAALARTLKKEKASMTDAETRLGFKQGYVSDAIKGTTRPNYSKRMALWAVYRIEMTLWDQDIVPKVKAVSP